MGRAKAYEVLTECENPTSENPIEIILKFITKLYGSNFLFLSINTPPLWHPGQGAHMAGRVDVHWVATLSFSHVNPFGDKMTR